MVLDRVLLSAGNKDNVFDPRGAALLDRILNQRLIHQRQHLLWYRLCRRKESRPEPAHWQHFFSLSLRFFAHICRELSGTALASQKRSRGKPRRIYLSRRAAHF